VARAFKNVSDAPALLLVIILGSDQSDIAYAPQVGEQVAARFGATVKTAIETHTSMKFTAGLAE
jgi:hypothetical protein